MSNRGPFPFIFPPDDTQLHVNKSKADLVEDLKQSYINYQENKTDDVYGFSFLWETLHFGFGHGTDSWAYDTKINKGDHLYINRPNGVISFYSDLVFMVVFLIFSFLFLKREWFLS